MSTSAPAPEQKAVDSTTPVRSYGSAKIPKWMEPEPQHSFMLSKMVKQMRSLRGPLKGDARNVLGHLADATSFQPGPGLHTCKLLRFTLADLAGLSERQVSKVVKFLEAGYITVDRNGDAANVYTLDIKAIHETAMRDHETYRVRLRTHLKQQASKQKERRKNRKKKLEAETARPEAQNPKGPVSAEEAAELDRVLAPPPPPATPPTPPTPLDPAIEALQDQWCCASLVLRDRIYTAFGRAIPSYDLDDDHDPSFVTMLGVIGEVARAADGQIYVADLPPAIETVTRAVDFALTDPFWASTLANKKFACPVAAFAHHYTKGKLGEQAWVKYSKQAPALKTITPPSPVEHDADEEDHELDRAIERELEREIERELERNDEDDNYPDNN